jgi:hypothetical protein
VVSPSLFKTFVVAIGVSFAAAFTYVVVPPLLDSGDIVGGFAAGFVNPYATGYALDTIACWCVLAVWVAYERSRYRVRHGWLALVLGVAPGVATGFALYLVLRMPQLERQRTAP